MPYMNRKDKRTTRQGRRFEWRYTRIAVVCALMACSIFEAEAQTTKQQQLVLDRGVPLRVIVTSKPRFRKNEPVHARIVEPVYAFDREVLPAGTEVLGSISGFRSAPRWKRITALAGGNFTPLREPQLTFD